MIYYKAQYGLGNVIQTTPTVRYLKSLDNVTLVADRNKEFIKAVYPGFPVVETAKATHSSANPAQFLKGGLISEVSMNLSLVGAPKNTDRSGFCGDPQDSESFDVLFCDGYNKRKNNHDWAVKSYPYWSDVANGLKDLKCASIGHPSEHIKGTIDQTGIGLERTFDLIRNAKLVVCNDTGFYHAAAAMGVKTLVVFTMTDTDKNYDPVFHKTARILSLGLPCQPCQLKAKGYWLRQKPICKWQCQKIKPQTIIDAIYG